MYVRSYKSLSYKSITVTYTGVIRQKMMITIALILKLMHKILKVAALMMQVLIAVLNFRTRQLAEISH